MGRTTVATLPRYVIITQTSCVGPWASRYAAERFMQTHIPADHGPLIRVITDPGTYLSLRGTA